VRYAAAHPELQLAGPEAPPQLRDARGWRALVGSALYAIGILAGIFIFPKLAAAAYLLVAVRGVLVTGVEGRLGLRGLFRRAPG
jgi:uncharacterized membrane protein YdcZ (DUF606 family)